MQQVGGTEGDTVGGRWRWRGRIVIVKALVVIIVWIC